MLGNVGKSTDTHTKYVTLIAFPWQQWLPEHTFVLHSKHTACIVGSLKTVNIYYIYRGWQMNGYGYRAFLQVRLTTKPNQIWE